MPMTGAPRRQRRARWRSASPLHDRRPPEVSFISTPLLVLTANVVASRPGIGSLFELSLQNRELAHERRDLPLLVDELRVVVERDEEKSYLNEIADEVDAATDARPGRHDRGLVGEQYGKRSDCEDGEHKHDVNGQAVSANEAEVADCGKRRQHDEADD